MVRSLPGVPESDREKFENVHGRNWHDFRFDWGLAVGSGISVGCFKYLPARIVKNYSKCSGRENWTLRPLGFES
jgi:hypothetical protein